MDFQEYIKPELLILIPVMYLIGMALKKSNAKDKLIPWILGAVAVLLSGVYLFSTSDINGVKAVASALFTALTQGVLIAGASVYVNQLIIQTAKKE